jgi:hypothetical protein
MPKGPYRGPRGIMNLLLGGSYTFQWAPPARATARREPSAIEIRLRVFIRPPPPVLERPQGGDTAATIGGQPIGGQDRRWNYVISRRRLSNGPTCFQTDDRPSKIGG